MKTIYAIERKSTRRESAEVDPVKIIQRENTMKIQEETFRQISVSWESYLLETQREISGINPQRSRILSVSFEYKILSFLSFSWWFSWWIAASSWNALYAFVAKIRQSKLTISAWSIARREKPKKENWIYGARIKRNTTNIIEKARRMMLDFFACSWTNGCQRGVSRFARRNTGQRKKYAITAFRRSWEVMRLVLYMSSI
jgi:hypothetical protein